MVDWLCQEGYPSKSTCSLYQKSPDSRVMARLFNGGVHDVFYVQEKMAFDGCILMKDWFLCKSNFCNQNRK